MYKIVIEQKRKHGMGYGYFLTKVFKHFNISLGIGQVGTAKQYFSKSTLVECECIKGRKILKVKWLNLLKTRIN